MSQNVFARGARVVLGLWLAINAGVASAGGGYFVLGYGTYANQMAGASTAVGLDGFAGFSNPGKLFAAGNRIDAGLKMFSPHREIERTGASDSIYDIDSTSRNSIFFLPEAGIARRINDEFSWGVILYGNGGLNTEYNDNNGVPGSNFNPAECGDTPVNFLLGCGKLDFDLARVIVAPSLGRQFAPRHSVGITALLTYQRVKV